MDETSSTCRHPDVQAFDSLRCCLSCGDLITGPASPAISDQPFEYEPLHCESEQHIRLVHVRPGQKQDDIVCELVHVSLASKPIYEAVSYTWATTNGDASLSQSIVCHGKKLAITKNCEAALRCVRRPNLTRVLWVDAICIDQTSTTERNHQVRLMDAVYSNASQVLLYLGFRYPATISGFLRYLDRRSRGIIAGDIWFDEPSLVIEFLQHPYFNRVWVLQEISLAKLVTLYTDSRTIHWDAHTVRELIFLCNAYKHNPPGVLNWLPATQRDEHDCLDLLNRARRCMATDPRDKVFALYGFLPLAFREALPINYAVDTEEVYWNLATHLMFTTRRLDVLKHVSPYQPLDLDSMPSWVPDWKLRDFILMELPKFTVAQLSKFPGGFSRMSIETWSNAELQSKATYTSHVNCQTQLSSLHTSFLGYRSQHTDHRLPISRSHSMRSSSIPYLRVRGCFLDTVTGKTPTLPFSDKFNYRDELRSQHEPRPFFGSSVCRSCSDENLRKGSFVPSFEQRSDYQWRQLSSLREVMMSFRSLNQIFETRQSVGFTLCSVVHESSQLGQMRRVESEDTIWALEGLDFPVILRHRIHRGEAYYIFVGQCYLHRAGLDHECPACGSASQPWLMNYTAIDIW